MASAARLGDVFAGMAHEAVPGARTVPDLEAALRMVQRLGGLVVSETRTAPGIGSWAFVCDRDGSELLLWQNSASAARRA